MSELHHWLRLQHSLHIGVSTARKLLASFGDLETALKASNATLAACGIAKPALEGLAEQPDERAMDADLLWASQPGNHIIPFISERYPSRLRSINDAPLLLYVRGDPDVLQTPQLAMVGSRNPTKSGASTAGQFAKHIAASGITITSGLALGIDAASHEGALSANGLTIAVAATGMDRIYPSRHRELAERVVEEGAIVSEFPVGTTARSAYFPRRNRIISGLSIGTLVVEAAVRSGSLTTARHAVEQGREVFAIPGSIHNPMARGCHQLIKQGAKLIELAEEILEELAPQLVESRQFMLKIPPQKDNQKPHQNPIVETLDDSYQTLLACIDYEPQAIDILIENSGFQAAEVSSMLLMLELNGQVIRTDGGQYSKC